MKEVFGAGSPSPSNMPLDHLLMLANLTNNQNEEWTASPNQNNLHHMQGAGVPPAAELPVLHAPSCCPAVRAELVTVSMGPQSIG